MRGFSPLCVGVLLGCIVTVAEVGSATERGPSTPQERAKAVELVDQLESAPESPEADEARRWLTAWLIEVPDLTVSFCLAPLGSTRDLRDVPPNLKIQLAFSQAAFEIRHPDVDSQSPRTFVAGVQGAMRAYDAMRSAQTVDELAVFEKLKSAKASGNLTKVVEKRIAQCE